MKLTAWAWLIAGGAVSLAIVAACVGDDPVTGGSGIKPDESIQKGRQGGRCDEGRCLSGLYCDTVNDVCLLDADAGDGGASSSGGSSGASSSGGSSGGGSSGLPNPCAFDAGPSTTRRCLPDGGSCPALCCLTVDQASCQTNEPICQNQSSGGAPLFCIGAGTCATGESCCLDATLTLDAGGCNKFSSKELLSTRCYDAGTCPGTTKKVCGDDSECVAPARCLKLTVNGGGAGANVALGTCL